MSGLTLFAVPFVKRFVFVLLDEIVLFVVVNERLLVIQLPSCGNGDTRYSMAIARTLSAPFLYFGMLSHGQSRQCLYRAGVYAGTCGLDQ